MIIRDAQNTTTTARDAQNSNPPEIALLMHNIRSTYNVGSLLRTAEGFGVAKVYYSGYTPVYDDPRLLPHLRSKLNHQIAKTALGAEKLVPQESVTSVMELIKKLHKDHWVILGLENHLENREVTLLGGIQEKLAKISATPKVALLLGEEVHGIPPELYPLIDIFAEIPMFGKKESFNVSVAAAIALYELRRNI